MTIDAATVTDDWEGRTAAWRHEAASLVLDAVLVHEHPAGIASTIACRRDDTDETYQARLRGHRRALVARRVELIWHA